MSSMNLTGIASAEAHAYGEGVYHDPFCTVEVTDDRGFVVSLFLGPDLARAQMVAEAIKLALAPVAEPQTLDDLLDDFEAANSSAVLT